MSPDPQILLHDVEDHGELGEDEDAVVPVLHVGQQAVERFELARLADLVVAQAVVLDTLEKKKLKTLKMSIRE